MEKTESTFVVTIGDLKEYRASTRWPTLRGFIKFMEKKEKSWKK